VTAEPPIGETAESSPSLWVALPASLALERYPLDLTTYLEEWALHLDPVAEIVDLATGALGDWATRGHFVIPGTSAITLLRETSRREEVALAFRASDGVLLRPDLAGEGGDVRLRATAHGDRLDSRALPVLLGLAVLCVETWPVGPRGTGHAARPASPEQVVSPEADEPA
jgi:hypothetical protein